MTEKATVNAIETGGQVAQGPGRDRGYFDLLAFIVSNAVAGEIMAVENYSQMVQLMPDVQSKVDTVHQAKEECKHIQLLSKLGRRLDFEVQQRIVEPQWNNIRKHFAAAVNKSDLAACLIIQDLMTESMAILLYTTLAEESDTDEQTAQVAANILQDELEHRDIGVKRIRGMLETDRAGVQDALVWAHHRVMPELFGMISTSCHSLCDELAIDCGSLTLDSIRTDIESLRIKALERYIETMDAVGFDSMVMNPLIASLSAYDGSKRVSIGMSSSGDCCGPSSSSGCC